MADSPDDQAGSEAAPEPASGDGPRVVLVDANEKRGERAKELLGDQFAMEVFSNPTTAVDELDRMVAVLVVTASFPPEDLEMLVYTARGRSPYCHVGLLAQDHEEIATLDVPRDEVFTSPLPWGAFRKRLGSMLVRAQYLAGLQRYYKRSLALNNRRIAGSEGEGSDEAIAAMEAELERLEGRLNALVEGFSPEEYRAVIERIQSDDDRPLGDGQAITNPGIYGLPEECPRCALEWGTWHGPGKGHGFERIAANVWRCTECDLVIDNPDPSHRHVAQR